MSHKADSGMFDFTADSAYLEKMLEYIEGYARKAELSGQECYDVRLGCEEVLDNIILYAYPGKTGTISIKCALHSNAYRLTIVIEDRGGAFNPLSIPEPDVTAPVEQRQIGGLGIFLSRKMFDSIEYERIDDVNRMTLYKK
jgi:serine/threonine-protein kinase RsbW